MLSEPSSGPFHLLFDESHCEPPTQCPRDLIEQVQLRDYPATLEPCNRWLLRPDARCELPLADLLPLTQIADEPCHFKAIELGRELGILLALFPNEVV